MFPQILRIEFAVDSEVSFGKPDLTAHSKMHVWKHSGSQCEAAWSLASQGISFRISCQASKFPGVGFGEKLGNNNYQVIS